MTKTIIIFHIFMAVFSTAEVSGQTALPTIFTDKVFVADDICSLIINEHPCVKNALSVLVDHINQNLQRIQFNKIEAKEERKVLESKLLEERKTHEKNYNTLRNDFEEIQNSLTEMINQNTMLKSKVDHLELNFRLSEKFPKIHKRSDNKFPYTYHLNAKFSDISELNGLENDRRRFRKGNSSMENGELYHIEKSSKKLKTSKKWYDSKTWETFGEILFGQFQEFAEKLDSSDTNELKRAFPAFPVKPPSERYGKAYAEQTDATNELYDYEEQNNIQPAKNPPFQRKIWRRMGQTIDRQFQALAGGAQAFISTATSIGPTVLPAASLTLGGTNFFNAMNQQNVLDEQQSSVDAISSRVAAVETAVASSTSSASSAAVTALETKVTKLENQMDQVGIAFRLSLCGLLEEIGSDTHCCANEENGQLHCAQSAVVATVLGIDSSNGKGTCDTGPHSSSDDFCKPDGEYRSGSLG